jgi:hypothetical protein
MINAKTLLMGVAVVAGGYLLLSGKGAEALTGGGGKPLPQTGILPGGDNGSFVFPADTFKGFAPIERTKIRLPESPFVGYPAITPPPYVAPSPAYIDDGDDGKPPVVTKPEGITIRVPEKPGETKEMSGMRLWLWRLLTSKEYEKAMTITDPVKTKKEEAIARGVPTGGEMPASVRIMLAESKLRKTAAPDRAKTETKKEHRLVTQAKAKQAYRSGRVSFGRGITGGN